MRDLKFEEIEDFVKNNTFEDVVKHIEDLQDWNHWYKIWHQKFKEEIEKLTRELETYRPTKIVGNGQTICSNCKELNWTCFGFYRYKGQILCEACLNKILK